MIHDSPSIPYRIRPPQPNIPDCSCILLSTFLYPPIRLFTTGTSGSSRKHSLHSTVTVMNGIYCTRGRKPRGAEEKRWMHHSSSLLQPTFNILSTSSSWSPLTAYLSSVYSLHPLHLFCSLSCVSPSSTASSAGPSPTQHCFLAVDQPRWTMQRAQDLHPLRCSIKH